MMELRLTKEEEELLLNLLQEHQTHLLREIAKAHHHEFRDGLRHRCTVLEAMLDRLQAPVHAAA
ncbi:MAG: hypothetical protein ABSC64_04195 [Candidatus Korobacteraceae bacterium]|jgi:hypothetical protein